MLSTSFAFRRHVTDGRHLANKVALTFADGTSKTLHGEDLMMGGVSFSSASSSVSGFDIGAAIVGSASVTLANHDERWNDYDFTGATCVISLGAVLDDDTTEWLRKGVYGISQPESYDSSITLECYDNMRLFQVPYSGVLTAYPASLQTIVTDICLVCGVTMLSASFPHCSQIVPTRPDDDRLSCLDVLSWAAQMAGCFADVDPWGRLRVRWYDTGAYETETWLDGGSYETDDTPYGDGDDADGGHFHYGGDSADGGSFTQPPWAVVTQIKTLTTATDDVVITGVKVTACDQRNADGTQGAKGESYTYGSEGYVISIEGNGLVGYGRAQSVAQAIGPSIVGMRFRPLQVTAIGDPAIEAGDPMIVIDWRQRTYRSWVTSNTWKQGSYQSLACNAKTPERLSAQGYSAVTRAIVEQRNMTRAEASARQLAMANLQYQLDNASGLFYTEEEQQDHSIIRYYHDKQTLAESQIVWKFVANAFAFSTDGGATYPYGLDVTGNAILNRIYAIGIDAEYVNVGSQSAPAAIGNAAKTATDYLTYGSGTGLDMSYDGANAKMRVTGSGAEIFDDGGVSAAYFGLSGNTAIARIGRASNSGNVVMSSDGSVDVRSSSSIVAHFGYGPCIDASGQQTTAAYYTLGTRASGSATGSNSFAVGQDNTASGAEAVAEGLGCTASGVFSHAEGWHTTASGHESHAEGNYTTASGEGAHAEGLRTTASGDYSHAEGGGVGGSGSGAGYTKALGKFSHAEGYQTTAGTSGQTASGQGCHAEGSGTTATGSASHAEGHGTTATGSASHAEGYSSDATGDYGSHAEGWNTTASGTDSHAEGDSTTASGNHSHAEGYNTTASAQYSHAEGFHTNATGSSQHVCGKYNTTDSSALFIVGAGSGSSNTKNVAYATASKFYVNGTEVVSDRRIKTHHAYLDDHTQVPGRSGDYLDERVLDFMRQLRPAIYDKNETTQMGFYAQDIEEYPLLGVCLVDQTRNYDMDDFRTLDYSSIIAPLTAYAQHLERRIEQQQRQIDEMRSLIGDRTA